MSRAVLRADGMLQFGRMMYRVAIGRSGIMRYKQEGDGGTPEGVLPLRKILYRADRIDRPRSSVPAEPIAPDDAWCDDPSHTDYNRQICLPHDGRYEELSRRDAVYDLIGVLGWNDQPIQRGRGSAIFIHVARPDFAPTDGCLALALGDLTAMLADGLREIEC